MKWLCITINTVTDAEDIISSALFSCGITGIQIENSLPPTESEMRAMYNDVLPETEPEGFEGNSRDSKVICYLRTEDPSDDESEITGGLIDDSYSIHDRIYSDDEIRDILNSISSHIDRLKNYSDIGCGTIDITVTSDHDWIDAWKQYYEPVSIGDLLILPEWMDTPDTYKEDVRRKTTKLIKLNPGTAFGTGSHETTRLSIMGLLKYLRPGDRLLDIGTGSGILGLCALAEGASSVTATEIDSSCRSSVEHNLSLNGVDSENFRLYIINLLENGKMLPETGFDIVTANILAPVIAALAAPGYADRYTAKGGYFITSGLAETREKEILDAFAANPSWSVTDIIRLNGWISIIARKLI